MDDNDRKVARIRLEDALQFACEYNEYIEKDGKIIVNEESCTCATCRIIRGNDIIIKEFLKEVGNNEK